MFTITIDSKNPCGVSPLIFRTVEKINQFSLDLPVNFLKMMKDMLSLKSLDSSWSLETDVCRGARG